MAEKNKRLHIRGVKQPSKRLEDDVIGRAKDLADNPGLLRPLCSSGASTTTTRS